MGKNKNLIRLIPVAAILVALFLLLSLLKISPSSDDTILPTVAVLSITNSTSQNISAASPTLTPTTTSLVVLEEPVPDQIIITFAPNTATEQRTTYIQAIGGTISKELSALDTVVVSVPTGTDITNLPTSPIVLSHESDYYAVALQESVNDPRYPEQWALPVIHASSAWAELSTVAVTVAVIDSGICAEHPDLQGHIVQGYDFVEGDPIPQDVYGHGCGVAGIIAAGVNNSIGITGIAPNAQIMPLRVLNAQGVGTYSDVAEAIIYAADHGASLINASLGGTQSSTLLENAVNYALSRGSQIVAAAGNTGNRILYPAAYEPVIAVGSIDRSLEPSSFSPTSQIDLYAPGRDILTTQIDGGYALMSGTSFAAPQVTGIAALEIAYGRTLTLNGGVVTFGGASSPVIVLPTATPGSLSPQYAALLTTVRARGSIRVIASLNVNFQPEGLLSLQAAQSQQAMIAQAQQSVMNALSGYQATLLSQSNQWVVPGIAYQVDEPALLYLMSLPEVVNLVEDLPLEQALDVSTGIVDAPEAWSMGYTGAGQTVVIIDSGIDSAHSDFGGRVVAEACYSWNQPDFAGTLTSNERNDSLCADGSVNQLGMGSAELGRCTLFGVDCNHGTHIAGIAAGEDSTYRGIAPDANIISIQVFTRWESCPSNPSAQCILSYTADQISALNYVYTTLRATYNIASINISIGFGRYFTYCDNDVNISMTNIINQLYAAQIPTVIASSNNGYSNSMSFPACISSAISVASTGDTNVVSAFSNTDDTLDLLAPGESIMSSLPGSAFGPKTGTSMATPHVVGAWALLRQAIPSLTVAQGLNALQSTGLPVLDSRNGLTFRRIDIDNAIAWFSAPTPTPAGYYTTTITDQALLQAMQAQTNTPLHTILVVIDPVQMNIYLDFNGETGIASVRVQNGNLVTALTIDHVTTLDGNPASETFVEAVNTSLPMILTGALDQILNAQFGGGQDAADIMLYNNYLSIGVIMP
jgi:subtilisin